MNKKVSIIIPVYNEVRTLPVILDRVQKQKPAEVIIVDDYSTDGSRELLEKYKSSNTKVFYHDTNQGKGAAIHTALKHVSQDVILIQDADLEYNPEEYDKLLSPIFSGMADVVYGSRFIGSSPHRVMLYWHYLGNKFITLLTNIFANVNLTDIETCYKAFRREAIESIKLVETDFGFEPEVTIKLGRKKWKFYEVGISYFGRSYDEGKKISWKDGFKAIWVILKHGLS